MRLKRKSKRFDAIDKLAVAMHAIEHQHYGTAMRIMGMKEKDFIGLTLQELAECLMVRMADVARDAGMVIDN